MTGLFLKVTPQYFHHVLQLLIPAEPLAALWRSRMTRWHSCLFRPDLTASAPSSPSRWPPLRGASPRRRPGDHGQGAAVTATMKMGLSPTVIWRRGSPFPSSMGTSLLPWCPSHWRTLTPSTAIRRSNVFLYIYMYKNKLMICMKSGSSTYNLQRLEMWNHCC